MKDLFDLSGKTAVITGGGGILGRQMAAGLAQAGAKVVIGDLIAENAVCVAKDICDRGGEAAGFYVNGMEKSSMEEFNNAVVKEFGRIDIAVNAIGGNMKDATTSEQKSFFDLSEDGLRKVIDLNLFGGAIIPCQVFGKAMTRNENGGAIVNISSMNSFRPLTRIPGYSAAKAAVSNFTQWLAVYMVQEFNANIRVNAIAPGFFLTEQNRSLLTRPEDGSLTDRGARILQHTPMGRFGQPEDLIGTLIWLVSDASKFVTGTVIPVDGGFSAYSGV